MLGLFLQPDAVASISAMDLPLDVKRHCAEVVWKGYTVIRNAVPAGECAALIDEFRAFEQLNDEIFTANRDQHGHYPRIVNLHTAFPPLISLFARNKMLLTVSERPVWTPHLALHESLLRNRLPAADPPRHAGVFNPARIPLFRQHGLSGTGQRPERLPGGHRRRPPGRGYRPRTSGHGPLRHAGQGQVPGRRTLDQVPGTHWPFGASAAA